MTYQPRYVLEAALLSDPFDASPVWTDLDAASRLVEIHTERLLGQAGTMRLVLHNQDDAFNSWNVASPFYGNLLTAEQASPTTTGEWVNQANAVLGNATVGGFPCLTLTSSGAGDMTAGLLHGVPVTPLFRYTAMASLRAGAGTNRLFRVDIQWYDATPALVSTTTGSTTATSVTGSFTGLTTSGLAPVGAVTAVVVVKVLGAGGAGEVQNVATIGLNGGTNTTWTPGGRAPMLDIDKKIRLSASWNQLTANQASVETDLTGHTAELNCSLLRSTARSATGVASVQLTAAAAGDMNGTTSPIGSTITGGAKYTAVCWFSAQSVQRNVRTVIRWYDVGNSFISQNIGATFGEGAGVGFIQTYVTADAPLNATRANVLYQVLSAGASEQHYVDALGIFPGTDPTWSAGGPEYLLTGFIESIDHEWPNIAYGDVSISVVDGSKALTLSSPASTAFYDLQVAHGVTALYRLSDRSDGPTVSTGVSRVPTAAEAIGGVLVGAIHGNAEFGQPGALPSEANGSMGLGVGRLAFILISGAEPVGTTDFAIECLVFPRSFPIVDFADRIWSEQVIGSQSVQIFLRPDGKIRFGVDDPTNGGTLDTTAGLTLNRWNHLVCSKIGTTGPANWKIVMNRADVSTNPVAHGTGNCSLTAYTSMIGGKDLSTSGTNDVPAFDGLIDEFGIYSTNSLTVLQAQAHYDAAHGLNVDALSGSRIGSILDLTGWPAADRNLDAGQFQVRPLKEPYWQTTPLSYIQTVVKSEGWPAAFFIAGDGKATFQDRAHSTPAAGVTFSDVGVYFYDEGVGPTRNDANLWPSVVYQASEGSPQQVTGTGRYLPRTRSVTDLINSSDADVATMAASDQARFKTARDRLDRVVLHPIDDPGNLWPQVLGTELNDRRTIERTSFPGGGSTFSEDCRIQGISLEVIGDDAHCTWIAAPT